MLNLRQVYKTETKNIETFENAVEPLVSGLKTQEKRKNYQQLCDAYVEYWKKRDGTNFPIPSQEVTIAGLVVRVSPEIGMKYSDDELALKLWLKRKRPTRQFRQVIHYMTERAKERGWPKSWQPALWDVRRGDVWQSVPLPRDFRIALEAQAAAFQQTWRSIDEQARREEL